MESRFIPIFLVVLIIQFFLLNSNNTFGQSSLYTTDITAWSSPKFIDFSPIYYNNGLVFCSNRKNTSIFSYHTSAKSLLSMYYVDINDSLQNKISLLSPKLTTQLNDGPATFSVNGDTIYFSRNLALPIKLSDQNDSLNGIGLFRSIKIKEKWQEVESLPFNNPSYSNKTPSLSNNGKRLFFSSNKPGGFGGYDLYYSDLIDGMWQEPINMGLTINTPYNESFPYLSSTDKIFFSSDRPKGFGGLDLYYTYIVENQWIRPIHLDEELNSAYDDFALVTSNNLISGYISSNRFGNDDILKFKKNLIQFDSCTQQKENKFCFQFYDERVFSNDTIIPNYEWDFGNNIKINGEKIKYCFPVKGKYSVTLRIINPANGDTINTPKPYRFELKDKEQAYISSDSLGDIGQNISFDALKTNLENFTIEEYYWDFGEGFDHKGSSINYSFREAAEYRIKLGLVGKYLYEETSKKVCVYKTIKITSKNNL